MESFIPGHVGDVICKLSEPDFRLSSQTAGADEWLHTILKLEQTNATELYSVPLGGPAEASQKINGTLVEGGSVTAWELSTNNQDVVYKADQDTLDIQELYLAELTVNEPTPPTPKPDWDYYLFIPLSMQD